MKLPNIYNPEIHEKGWGHEKWCANNDEFCGKILVFKKGCKLANHFHLKKKEVFFCRVGLIKLILIDTKDASKVEYELNPGDCIEINRGQPHQIMALEDSEIIEFSTHHEDSDSYRVEKGDSQK